MKVFFKYIIVSFLLFFVVIPSVAQGKMRVLGGGDKVKISFKLINNLIVIPVTVNGKELSFILDTGASNTILFGITKIDSLTLNNTERIKLYGLGGGDPIDGLLSKGNKLQIKSIVGFEQQIHVVSDDKFDLSSQMGVTIHGIIGYDLFKDFVVAINYKRQRLTFYNPKKYKRPRSRRYKAFNMPIHYRKPFINAKAVLQDDSKHSLNLLIDSGNSDALWIFENSQNNIELHSKYFVDYLGEGLSGSVVGKRGKIQSFSIGDFVFKHPTTAFLDSLATERAGSQRFRQGSIGSLILQRFKVVIDYPHNKIYLKKAKSFKDEFRYNRAGVELVYSGKTIVEVKAVKSVVNKNDSQFIDFEIVYKYKFEPVYKIKKIRPNSVAERAGLRVGDVLYKMKGELAYKHTYKELVGFFYDDFGTNIHMVVYRDGVEKDIHFVLEKIL